MKFKKIFVFLIALLLTVMLTGCLKDEKLVILNEASLVNASQKIKEKEGEVRFRIPFGKEIQDTIREQFVDKFNKILKEKKIKAKVVLEVESGYDTLLKKNRDDALHVKYAPHISVAYPDHIAKYLISGVIQEMSSLINHKTEGFSEDIKDFIPSYLEETRNFDAKHTYYGLPFNKSTEVMYYNKSFMEKFPIEYLKLVGENIKTLDTHEKYKFVIEKEGVSPTIKVPETWEELETFSRFTFNALRKYRTAIKEKNINPDKIPNYLGGSNFYLDYTKGDNNGVSTINGVETFAKLKTCMYDSLGNLFTTAMHQMGAPYTEAIKNSDGAINIQYGNPAFLNNKKSQEAILRFKELFDNQVLGVPAQWDEKYASTLFSAGRVLLNVGSSAGTTYYSAGFDMGIAPVPYFEGENKREIIQQGTNLVLFNKGTNVQKNVAWMFVKFLLSKKNVETFATKTGYFPVRKSVIGSDSFKAFVENGMQSKSLIAAVNSVLLNNYESEDVNKRYNQFTDPAWGTSSEIRNNSETFLRNILIDLDFEDEKINVKTQRDEALAKINTYFKKIVDASK